jgi:hypothetical protein
VAAETHESVHVEYSGRYFCPILSKTGNFRKISVPLSNDMNIGSKVFFGSRWTTRHDEDNRAHFCRISLGTRKKCINNCSYKNKTGVKGW